MMRKKNFFNLFCKHTYNNYQRRSANKKYKKKKSILTWQTHCDKNKQNSRKLQLFRFQHLCSRNYFYLFSNDNFTLKCLWKVQCT